MKSVLVVIALAVLAAGCPADDECGPGDAPGDGLTVTGTGVDLRYHGLAASPNNDCPDPGAPTDVVSLTIQGTQVGGASAFTLCVPRPDMLDSDLQVTAPATPHAATIEVVDLNAMDASCDYTDSATVAPTGTAHAEGLCADGTDPAGFALLINAQVTLDRTCGATMDTVVVTVAGTVSVAGS